jgi:3-methyladenine DNA glycosylase Tag
MQCNCLIPNPYVDALTEEQLNLAKAAFSHFDKDSSGTISKKEMQQCLAEAGVVLTPDACDAIVDKASKDGNDTISFSEYLIIFAENLSPEHADELLAKRKALKAAGALPAIAVSQTMFQSGVVGKEGVAVGGRRTRRAPNAPSGARIPGF